MYKIAVLGDYDSIYGFSSLGLTTFPVEMDTPVEEAAKILRKVAESDYGVIYMTEALAAELPEDLERYGGQLVPAIIRIPGVHGNTGAGIQGVKDSVEKAVGSDILFGGEA
jgi:V/A-type H+-transporting ATPase subunit F